MSCTDCRDSILNNQGSIIATPACQDNCPEEVDCAGISTYSKCVMVGIALECIDTQPNTPLDTVLALLDNKACQAYTDTYKVKVDVDDTCPGFLDDKIESDSFVIDISDNSGCKKITINEKRWADLYEDFPTLSSPWEEATGTVASLQYAIRNDEVRFKGAITIPTIGNEYPSGGYVNIATLPAEACPTEPRIFFQTFGKSAPPANAPVQWTLIINTDGSIDIITNTLSPGDTFGSIVFYLDIVNYTL